MELFFISALVVASNQSIFWEFLFSQTCSEMRMLLPLFIILFVATENKLASGFYS